jgi:hypothetical protein
MLTKKNDFLIIWPMFDLRQMCKMLMLKLIGGHACIKNNYIVYCESNICRRCIMSGEACGQLVEADEAMVNGAEVPDVVAEAFDEGADSIWMVDGDVEVSDNSPNVRRRGHGVRLIMAGAVMTGGALGATSEAGAGGQCSPDGVRVVSVAGAVSAEGVGGGPGTLSVKRYNPDGLSPSVVARHQPSLADDGKITRADIGKNVLVLDGCDPSPKQVSRVKSETEIKAEQAKNNALAKVMLEEAAKIEKANIAKFEKAAKAEEAEKAAKAAKAEEAEKAEKAAKAAKAEEAEKAEKAAKAAKAEEAEKAAKAAKAEEAADAKEAADKTAKTAKTADVVAAGSVPKSPEDGGGGSGGRGPIIWVAGVTVLLGAGFLGGSRAHARIVRQSAGKVTRSIEGFNGLAWRGSDSRDREQSRPEEASSILTDKPDSGVAETTQERTS